MKKTIVINCEFPDDFVPPDKFDSCFDKEYGGTGKCVRCPFYKADTYEPIDECCCPSCDYEIWKYDKCPIKKYFE